METSTDLASQIRKIVFMVERNDGDKANERMEIRGSNGEAKLV